MMSLSSVIETITNLIRRSSVLRMSTRYLRLEFIVMFVMETRQLAGLVLSCKGLAS